MLWVVEPVVHAYVRFDGAVKTTESPSQKLNDEPLVIVAVGSAFTATEVPELSALHPADDSTSTVYVPEVETVKTESVPPIIGEPFKFHW